jgi:CrcB protein
MTYLIVFLGAGTGGTLRYLINIAVAQPDGGTPIGTLGINVVGSLAMGGIAEYFALRGPLPQDLRLFLTTGILGGFTTFSSFSAQAVSLYEQGDPGAAAAYVIGSVVLSLGALFAALTLVRTFARK